MSLLLPAPNTMSVFGWFTPVYGIVPRTKYEFSISVLIRRGSMPTIGALEFKV